MAERAKPQSGTTWMKPVPMKLFAAWEVDRTAPNCIPRLCTLTITRLVILKPLGADISSIMIAVKMQSSKRILRSNEIMIPNGGLLDTELDLSFSLQYPHFLKRSGNNLQIMLQKSKRYKNRAILGFKTLAGGVINMAEVLQRPMDKELELISDVKEKSPEVFARITMLALSSQPVQNEEGERRKRRTFSDHTDAERADVDNFSDEEEEFSSNEEGSDSEPIDESASGVATGRIAQQRDLEKAAGRKYRPNVEDRPDPSQRNFKQKFIALLKKFRVPDSEVFDNENYQEGLDSELMTHNTQEIEDLFDELDDFTDSGQEVDDLSISSTPKPSLRPFFSSCTLAEPDIQKNGSMKEDNAKKAMELESQDGQLDNEHSDVGHGAGSPPKSEEKKAPSTITSDKEKKSKLFSKERHVILKEKRSPSVKDKEKNSSEKTTMPPPPLKEVESSPRKTVLEQLNRIFPADDTVPDLLLLVSISDSSGHSIIQHLDSLQHLIIPASSMPDLRACFNCLVNKIQKFCNCNSRAPPQIRIGIIGSDSFLNLVLRLYVDSFSNKPPEWQTYVRFYVIPLGTSLVAKYLGSIDGGYNSTFVESSWKDLIEYSNEALVSAPGEQIATRIQNYLDTSCAVYQLPIAEAMVICKDKCSEEESSQVFIPFVSDVKIGMMEGAQQPVSLDLDEPTIPAIISGSSPPPVSHLDIKPVHENITPPNSPIVTSSLQSTTNLAQQQGSQPTTQTQITSNASSEPAAMDLAIDYWPTATKGESGKKSEVPKVSLKSTFRTLVVSRLPSPGDLGSSSLTLSYYTKEKKQKIMRLGKKKEKERDPEAKLQVTEGIHRLICACKTSQVPFKITIDGVEWSAVKFFQLTAQWQSHVKNLPVALFSIAAETAR